MKRIKTKNIYELIKHYIKHVDNLNKVFDFPDYPDRYNKYNQIKK